MPMKFIAAKMYKKLLKSVWDATYPFIYVGKNIKKFISDI